MTSSNESRKARVLQHLASLYPNARCELDFQDPYQLLVATILSAQCTDERVNLVTPGLFREYPTPQALTQASPEEVESHIHSLGLFRSKAKNLIQMAQALVREYDGEVPSQREALEGLPGVGRKTASVVLSNAFGIPALAVDTHVHRVANRLGLAQAQDVLKTEEALTELIPRSEWIDAHHRLIWHGRRLCHARKPQCRFCPLAPDCPSAT